MKSLVKAGGYSAERVRETLVGHRAVRFTYERYDVSGRLLGPLSGVWSASVDHSAFAEIKRTAHLQVNNDPEVDYVSERVKPYMQLQMPDGIWLSWPLGLFVMSSPTRRSHTQGEDLRQISAYDQTVLLSENKVGDRYIVPKGTNVVDHVAQILRDVGVAQVNAVHSDKVLPSDREWEPGTPLLKIVNELLAAINYLGLWFDSHGAARLQPYVAPEEGKVGEEYLDNEKSILFPQITSSLDLFDVPNHWVLVVSEPDREPLRAEYTNTNPDSPTSTVSRGITVTDFRTTDQSVDQPTLDAAVRRLAVEASQVYEKVTLETRLMPHHEHLETIRVRARSLDVFDDYQEVAWKMELKAGGRMTHELRKLVVL